MGLVQIQELKCDRCNKVITDNEPYARSEGEEFTMIGERYSYENDFEVGIYVLCDECYTIFKNEIVTARSEPLTILGVEDENPDDNSLIYDPNLFGDYDEDTTFESIEDENE